MATAVDETWPGAADVSVIGTSPTTPSTAVWTERATVTVGDIVSMGDGWTRWERTGAASTAAYLLGYEVPDNGTYDIEFEFRRITAITGNQAGVMLQFFGDENRFYVVQYNGTTTSGPRIELIKITNGVTSGVLASALWSPTLTTEYVVKVRFRQGLISVWKDADATAMFTYQEQDPILRGGPATVGIRYAGNTNVTAATGYQIGAVTVKTAADVGEALPLGTRHEFTTFSGTFAATAGTVTDWQGPTCTVTENYIFVAAEGRIGGPQDYRRCNQIGRRIAKSDWGTITDTPAMSDMAEIFVNPAGYQHQNFAPIWLGGDRIFGMSTIVPPGYSQGQTGASGETLTEIGYDHSNTSRLVCAYSEDGGLTWGAEFDITEQVKHPNTSAVYPGPGCGLRMRNDTLVVCLGEKYKLESDLIRGVIIYSTDNGRHWQRGASYGVASDRSAQETQAAELPGGGLLLTIRSTGFKRRLMCYVSSDLMRAWGHWEEQQITDPVIEEGLVGIPQRGILLLSHANHDTNREAPTLRYDLTGTGKYWNDPSVPRGNTPGGTLLKSGTTNYTQPNFWNPAPGAADIGDVLCHYSYDNSLDEMRLFRCTKEWLGVYAWPASDGYTPPDLIEDRTTRRLVLLSRPGRRR